MPAPKITIAPNTDDVHRQVVRFMRLGIQIRSAYKELHDEAYGMSGREKLRYQHGEVSRPTEEILLAKSERQRMCAKFGRRIAGAERLLEAIANDLDTALRSEGTEPDYREEAETVSAADRARIHREREDALRSAS